MIPQWEWLSNKMVVLGSFCGKQSVLLVCNSSSEDCADCRGGGDFMIINWPSLYVHPQRNAWCPNESDYPTRWEYWDPFAESNLSFWYLRRRKSTCAIEIASHWTIESQGYWSTSHLSDKTIIQKLIKLMSIMPFRLHVSECNPVLWLRSHIFEEHPHLWLRLQRLLIDISSVWRDRYRLVWAHAFSQGTTYIFNLWR